MHDLLTSARSAAQALMTSSCTITRPGNPADRVWDEQTGTYAEPEPVVVYEGPCKVQDPRQQVQDVDSGEASRGVVARTVHLPVDAPGSGDVTRGDRVTVTACPGDPALVGRVLVVRGPHSGSAKTARRLPVEEVL